MRKSLHALLLIILSVTTVAITVPVAAQEDFTPTFTPAACTMPVPSGYVEGENFICGTVAVPEFHADPTGDTIQLSVLVLKSEGDAPDPLVMFNGGPGSDILGLLPLMMNPTADSITQHRDVVLMSERGSFGADPLLTCPELLPATEGQFGIDLNEWNALRLEAFIACKDRLASEGVDLNAYNNPERAADVPMVMQALGYTDYNMWGVSGGGIMTQYVLRDHPEGVRTLMTDSGAFPTAYIGAVFFNIYDIVSNAYSRLFETCAADAACNEAYPDLETVFWGAVDQLNAEPASVQITDPATGTVVDWELTGDVVVALLGNEFANVEVLPQVMYQVAAGDYSYVLDRVPNLYLQDLSYADALYQSVVCSETAGLTQETASKANAYPQVVAAIEDQLQFNIDLCAAWDVNPVPEGPVITSDVPILIMEGKFDSNKPPQLGETVAQNFSTSYLVEFADTAHGVIGPCALTLMGQFMDDPTTAPDASCVATQTTFVLPGQEVTFSEVTLDAFGVTALLPDNWQEIDTGVYLNPTDGAILLITALPGEDIEAAIAAFSAAVDLPMPEKLGDLPVGNYTWSVYQVINGGTGSTIAATSLNGQVYLAGIQTSSMQLDVATDGILRPVVESLTIAE